METIDEEEIRQRERSEADMCASHVVFNIRLSVVVAAFSVRPFIVNLGVVV